MSSKIEGILPHSIREFEQIEVLRDRLLPVLKGDSLYEWGSTPPSSGTGREREWHIGLWGRPSKVTPREQWASGKGPMLFAIGPSLIHSPFWLVLGRRCLFATTGVKWPAAMRKPSLFHGALDYFRAVGIVLGSSELILYRDNGCLSWDWVLAGMAIEEIECEMIRYGAQAVPNVDAFQSLTPQISTKTNYYWELLSRGG